MRYFTAGESHGKALTAIIEGMPSGVKLSLAQLNAQLARRKQGYGRGGRMKIESDAAEILSGVRGGLTLGSPITVLIRNKDFENWADVMGSEDCDFSARTLTKVRPGHADLIGCVKYGFSDARNVLERASARETAARVAAGAVCRALLSQLGIEIGSHVLSIGEEKAERVCYTARQLIARADNSAVRCMDDAAAARMRKIIADCAKEGDTLGGKAEIVISGVPAGLGSYVHYDRKLDAALAGAFMGVQAIKAVEIGDSFDGSMRGSQVHDEIYPDGKGGVFRKTNRAGGIEGGMSNGEDIVIRAVMKPIPTLMRGLNTVDTLTGESAVSQPERSDVCAVPAAAVVLESVAACVIAGELLKCTGGDSMSEIAHRVEYMRKKQSSCVR